MQTQIYYLIRTMSLLVAVLFAGCAKQHQVITTDHLEPYECGTITRLHTLGGVFLASQPQPEDFRQAQQGGVKTVLNLRLPEEKSGFDEAKLINELGIAYYNVGYNGPDMLTDKVINHVRDLLNDPANKPLLVHCSSANRVGAIWLAHRVIDGNLGYNEALQEAKIVGLKSPAYEQKVKNYIERYQRRQD